MNCAQSVCSAFAADMLADSSAMLRIASCFGGGMRMGATCGALTGALMILGLAGGFSVYDPVSKQNTERLTLDFLAAWKQKVGQTDCKEILGIDPSLPGQRELARERGIFDENCPHCIETAVELLETILKEHKITLGDKDV
ncbi:MAG TPA: C-GCAxxG-C-C family protein [Candidatus Cloacimonadota bacterium]|nr:C-GCAxxG-C-C family protein [Candidatus Cloacimonadota bacterium]